MCFIYDNVLNILKERDLHSILNKFCYENLNIRTKTIYHEKSIKNKGKSEWLHPDMVGFQLTTSNWNDNIISVCKDFYVSKAILYSFELKKSITIDTLREYYFQAVSNSSWSNEVYLVTALLDEENIELISEIKRLVGAFGIGIIKLDILNPKNSSILFPAKRKDVVDGETMNKLYSINPDYQSYIQKVSKSLQINQLVETQWDNLNEYNKVVSIIEKYTSGKKSIKDIKIDTTNIKEDVSSIESNTIEFKENMSININDKAISEGENIVTLDIKNIDLNFSKPVKFVVENKIYNSNTWSSLMFDVAYDLKKYNPSVFKEYVKVSAWCAESKIWKHVRYSDKLKLYLVGLSSIDIYKELRKLLIVYNIDLNECKLYYNKQKRTF